MAKSFMTRLKQSQKDRAPKNVFIIELDSESCSAYHNNGSSIRKVSVLGFDLQACTRSGDAEPACQYIIERYKPKFVLIRENTRQGVYIQAVATHKEKEATCQLIYSDSDTDFSKSEAYCDIYLVWAAAHSLFQ